MQGRVRKVQWTQPDTDLVILMAKQGRLRGDIAKVVGHSRQAVSGLIIRLRRAGKMPPDTSKEDYVPPAEETERKCLTCQRMFMSSLPKANHRICDQHSGGASDWMDTAYGYSAAVG